MVKLLGQPLRRMLFVCQLWLTGGLIFGIIFYLSFICIQISIFRNLNSSQKWEMNWYFFAYFVCTRSPTCISGEIPLHFRLFIVPLMRACTYVYILSKNVRVALKAIVVIVGIPFRLVAPQTHICFRHKFCSCQVLVKRRIENVSVQFNWTTLVWWNLHPSCAGMVI